MRLVTQFLVCWALVYIRNASWSRKVAEIVPIINPSISLQFSRYPYLGKKWAGTFWN